MLYSALSWISEDSSLFSIKRGLVNCDLYLHPLYRELGQPPTILIEHDLIKKIKQFNCTYTKEERIDYLTRVHEPGLQPPILYALANRNWDVIEVLLEDFTFDECLDLALTKATSGKAVSALFYAITEQYSSTAAQLLGLFPRDRLFETLEEKGWNNQTLFHTMVESKNRKILYHLGLPIDKKIQLATTEDKSGMTPLLYAVKAQDHETIGWMLDGLSLQQIIAVLTKTNSQGKNAVYAAMMHSDNKTFNFLKTHPKLGFCEQGASKAQPWIALIGRKVKYYDRMLSPLAIAIYRNCSRKGRPLSSPFFGGYSSSYSYSAYGSRYSRNYSKVDLQEFEAFFSMMKGLTKPQMYQLLMDNSDALIAGFESSDCFKEILGLYFSAQDISTMMRHAVDELFCSGSGSDALKALFSYLPSQEIRSYVTNARFTATVLKQSDYVEEFNLTPLMVTLFNQDETGLREVLDKLDNQTFFEQLIFRNDNQENALMIAMRHYPKGLYTLLARLNSDQLNYVLFQEKDIHGKTMFELGALGRKETRKQFCSFLNRFDIFRKVGSDRITKELDRIYQYGAFEPIIAKNNLPTLSEMFNDILALSLRGGVYLRNKWFNDAIPAQPYLQEADQAMPRWVPGQKLMYALMGGSYDLLLDSLLINRSEYRTNLLNKLIIDGHFKIVGDIFNSFRLNNEMCDRLLNDRDINGYSAIMIAAHFGHWALLKCFLDQFGQRGAANILRTTKVGDKNALVVMMENGHSAMVVEVIQYFTAENLKKLLMNRQERFFFIHFLASNGHGDLIREIFEHLPQSLREDLLHTRNIEGQTPYMIAMSRDDAATAEILQQLGGDLHGTQAYEQPETQRSQTWIERIMNYWQAGAEPVVRDPLAPLPDAPPAWLAPPVHIPRAPSREPTINHEQSSHDSQVEKDCIDSAIRLARIYKTCNLDTAIKDMTDWLYHKAEQNPDTQTAQRALAHIASHPALRDWQHGDSGISLKDVLAYLWLGLSDKNCQKGQNFNDDDIEERRKKVISSLTNVQRAYNIDQEGRDHGGRDGVSCPGGAFNIFVNGLNGSHDAVEIRVRISDAVISQKASAVAADLFCALPPQQMRALYKSWTPGDGLTEQLWEVIGPQTKQLLVKEFGQAHSMKIEQMYDAYLQYMPPPPKVTKALDALSPTVEDTLTGEDIQRTLSTQSKRVAYSASCHVAAARTNHTRNRAILPNRRVY